jgi:hypothetical protein
MGQQFTAAQLSRLKRLFAEAGDNLIPGTWIVDGTLPVAKADLADFLVEFASAAQGLLAGTAVQPGDNVSVLTNDAGYQTATLRKEVLTALGGETQFVLAQTPVGAVQVFLVSGGVTSLWEESVDYTIVADTLTFAALGAGDKVHVYYMG